MDFSFSSAGSRYTKPSFLLNDQKIRYYLFPCPILSAIDRHHNCGDRMNYLAHLYLAENNDASLVGSLLGDFVKGGLKGQLDPEIRQGILLHRSIDRFADVHPVHLRSRRRVSARRRRYAGIIIDMAYDHFLAQQWSRFHDEPLERFANRVYSALYRYQDELAPRLREILPRMAQEDWLSSYRDLDRIGMSLDRLALRLSRPSPLAGAVAEIRAAYRGLGTDFMQILPALKRFTAQRHGSSIASASPRGPGCCYGEWGTEDESP